MQHSLKTSLGQLPGAINFLYDFASLGYKDTELEKMASRMLYLIV